MYINESFYRNLSELLTPYFEVGSSVICFDSGEHSKRNVYIYKTLKYLINDRGIPSIILCDSNVHKTKYFLHKLPESIKSKITNNYKFREYLKVSEICRDLLETLYLSKENLELMETFLIGLRVCTAALIKDLKEKFPSMIFILDRTPLTGMLYTKAIRKDFEIKSFEPFYRFKPIAHFFIESVNQPFISKNPLKGDQTIWASYPLYDGLEGLNDRISLLANNVAKDYSLNILVDENININEVSDKEKQDNNFNKIKSIIDKELNF